MIKYSTLLVGILMIRVFLSQSVKQIVCFDQTTYEVNDTIVFGPPSKSIDRYRYIYYNNGAEGEFVNLDKDLCYSKFRIIKLENSNDSRSRFVITAKNKGFLSYKFRIDIENAIRVGEITLPNSKSGETHYAYKLTDTTLFICSCKLDSNCQIRQKEFFARFSGDNYILAKQNEFKRNELISNSNLRFEKFIGNYTLDTMFQIGVDFIVGEYDFSTNSFPLEPLKNAYTIDLVGDPINDTSYNSITLDLGQLDTLSMSLPVNEAEMFLKRQESLSGYIDRNIYGIVCFRPSSILDENNKTIVRVDMIALYLFESEKRKGTLLDYQEFR